jgi:hypothetical protein
MALFVAILNNDFQDFPAHLVLLPSHDFTAFAWRYEYRLASPPGHRPSIDPGQTGFKFLAEMPCRGGEYMRVNCIERYVATVVKQRPLPAATHPNRFV